METKNAAPSCFRAGIQKQIKAETNHIFFSSNIVLGMENGNSVRAILCALPDEAILGALERNV